MNPRQQSHDQDRMAHSPLPNSIEEDASDITVEFASGDEPLSWPASLEAGHSDENLQSASDEFECIDSDSGEAWRSRDHGADSPEQEPPTSTNVSLADKRPPPSLKSSQEPLSRPQPGQNIADAKSFGDVSGVVGDSSSESELFDVNQAVNGMRLATAAESRVNVQVQSLRRRLAAVAFLLGGGLVAFLAWYLISVSTSTIAANPFAVSFLSSVLFAQMLVATGLLLTGLWLVFGRTNDLWKLHLVELFVFGLPAILFTLWQYEFITQFARAHNVLPSATGAWVLLMFTYALFIPNGIARAAVYISLFALLPSSLTIYLVYFHDGCCEAVNASTSYVVQMLMQIALGGVTASVGVAMIGGLRQEASKARELGQYVLLEKIGQGGMGEVFRGEHRLMKRPCAIKLIRPERAGNPRTLARFEREVSATSQLSHWNTVDIYDYGRANDGTFFYVMEYLPGLTLQQLVSQHGPIPPARVIHLLRQVCYALEEAHAHKLIHRDIKPSNIMVCNRGGVYDVIKLLDFGLVKPLIETESEHVTQDQAITGSPRFMSPEQATGEKRLEPTSDIYSLGCVAYFMLAGRPPFEETQVIRAIMAHATKIAPPVSSIEAGVGADLDAVVAKCLDKTPERRFQTVQELREALQECLVDAEWGDDDAAEWWQP